MKTRRYRAPRFAPCLECLEGRDVPSVVIVNATTATYTDVDGDHVTIKVSKGILKAGDFTTLATGLGDQLQQINLTGSHFERTNLTVSVVKVAGGDGLANVGEIRYLGLDFGTVVVNGDLGRITAGSNNVLFPAVQSLTVNSLGRFGTDTQMAEGTLESDIIGGLGKLTVKHDVDGAFVNVTGGFGKIGSITIGGSVIGEVESFSGLEDDSGAIFSSDDMGPVKIADDVQGSAEEGSGHIGSGGKLASVSIGGSLIDGGISGGSVFDVGSVTIRHDMQGGLIAVGKHASVSIGGSLIGGTSLESGAVVVGDMGTVKIGHNVQGGSGQFSGYIAGTGKLASVSVGGSVIGGSNNDSGAIFSQSDLGTVKIGHDVQGGSGPGSGFIASKGKLAGVSIGGSLIGGSFTVGSVFGGSNFDSGEIFSQGDVGAVKIGHDLIGGSITGAASVADSGLIESGSRIASVTIGGSIVSGTDDSSGTLATDATILSADDIGSITVKGSLVGNVTANGASPVIIAARGQAVQGKTSDLAIGKINIGGRVEFADILAGYEPAAGFSTIASNGDAQIGAVTVGGDWVASSLVAGAMNAASSNMNFGDANDASIGAGSAGIIAKIASITIGGQVVGTPNSTSNSDHFGFVAEQINAVKIGGNTIALKAGPTNDNFDVGETNDMTVHEV
jgi:hypothetical protein